MFQNCRRIVTRQAIIDTSSLVIMSLFCTLLPLSASEHNTLEYGILWNLKDAMTEF